MAQPAARPELIPGIHVTERESTLGEHAYTHKCSDKINSKRQFKNKK